MAGPGRNAAFAVLGMETGLAWLVACPLPALAQESAGRPTQDPQVTVQRSGPNSTPDALSQSRGYEGRRGLQQASNLVLTPAALIPVPLRRSGQSADMSPPSASNQPPHQPGVSHRFGPGPGTLRIAQEFAPRRAAAPSGTVANHIERVSPTAMTIATLEDDLALSPEGLEDRRRYRDRDLMSYIKHRNWNFATYLGLDLADALDVREPWLRDLSLGVEWPKIKSVVAAGRRSNPAAPAITMGIAF